MKKPQIIAMVGPTASGKSDLAVQLAQKINGEIISADSRQVYRGMNIGTGKITKKEMRGIPHHLLDVADPKNQFSVAEYKKLADTVITEILTKNKVPILCGGTGFYIDAVVDNIVHPEVPPNEKLRAALEMKTADELLVILKNLDRARANSIDKNNPRRLIRAIEIALALGKVPTLKPRQIYQTLMIGIKTEPESLRTRIKDRLLTRLKKGMITEAKKLHSRGLSWKRMDKLGLEYRYLALFLQKRISKQEMIEKLNTEIWHYAKRQMTWFKRNKRIKWFAVSEKTKVISATKKFLK